jgi:hypothetical protein
MKSRLGKHAATSLDQPEAMVRSRVCKIQRCPDLINAFLGQTGLTGPETHQTTRWRQPSAAVKRQG